MPPLTGNPARRTARTATTTSPRAGAHVQLGPRLIAGVLPVLLELPQKHGFCRLDLHKGWAQVEHGVIPAREGRTPPMTKHKHTHDVGRGIKAVQHGGQQRIGPMTNARHPPRVVKYGNH